MTAAQETYQASPKEVRTLFEERHKQLCARTDRSIAFIMCMQWIIAILAAYIISPQTWQGSSPSIHPHLIAAIYIGGLITLFPVYMVIQFRGDRFTRHIVAACQLLMSALLIHITGGRIETHFHIFGSLAFLAFYLDWQVLLTATVTTLLHHSLFGYFAPVSIFGTVNASAWRFSEHVLWVVFFDIFLIISCTKGIQNLKDVAQREADHIFRSFHDSLTGLANRALLQKAFEENNATSPEDRVLMVMDLDRFKQVNDTLGHRVGDHVLVEVSRRMKDILGEETLLVRTGGDEFAALIDNPSSLQTVELLASRIVSILTLPILSGEHIIQIGVSIGICPRDQVNASLSDLLHCADLALYKAKNTGRNRYLVFEESMKARSLQEMSIEYRLRSAIDQGSFKLHYQPIVSADAVLLGFEALLRWEDGANGEIPLSDFLPVAEDTGLIVPLGEWVIREACAQAAAWHRSGNKLVKMSVNVSARQLASESFVGNVLRCLVESGLPPAHLCLEMTENVLAQNYPETSGPLRLLSNYGVELSIDDFTIDPSSWTYPADLPIHTLKIDRRVTRAMMQSDDYAERIGAAIGMAHMRRLTVVAKGVETREQLELLRGMGCDEIQGFHISQAVSSERAKELLETYSKVDYLSTS
ncbi:putative bifunctional diguanylate cyclase/phosphodiesterase [Granulicella tundricola]|uniref:Diguanylate cyclase/phosphodiesterase n=1 Tax=Granulicella tundricola (strain ATCC BAA-1859 / DSM 23138 / MP5ACTX9) TaxID=1198114 RepID=E8X6C7_GRATM|nr:bifunctional diguanylate cyclase/phosphodiesterase [Granulicella tundricola]ADW71011.1 diguanylate cyclase/phosphodiesterase [Granulicella tundricola MP5ACTX9]